MTYKLTMSQKPSYLHAIVTGRNSRENVMRYLEEIRSECIARRCFRVLVEERLEGSRIGAMDVFQIALEGSSKARGTYTAFAYVDVNADGDLMRFAETVAVNRGMPVAVFSTVADAERWLLAGDDCRRTV
jgi:urocanate hydratase